MIENDAEPADRLEAEYGIKESDVFAEILERIRTEGEPFIDTWKTPRDFVYKSDAHTSNPDDLHVLRTAFYSSVLVDEPRAAEDFLGRMQATFDRYCANTDIEWPRVLMMEARKLRDAYRESQAKALELLHRWRKETLENLRLTKFAVDPPDNE